ncbi:MAG: hypothetical protein R3E08_02205 [Thiotrichaceae bacterium]
MPMIPKSPQLPHAKLSVRNAQLSDVSQIKALVAKAYPDIPTYTNSMLRGQINNFPEGQFVVTYGENVIGYCATFQISGEVALKPHTWAEITVMVMRHVMIPKVIIYMAWRFVLILNFVAIALDNACMMPEKIMPRIAPERDCIWWAFTLVTEKT